MKQILIIAFLLSAIFSARAQAQSKKDTSFLLIGYNCTDADGRIFDGNRGLIFTGLFPTVKAIEDEIFKSSKVPLKKVIILSFSRFKNRREWELFYSASNNKFE